MRTYKPITFIIFYVFVSSLIILIFSMEKDSKIQKYLKDKTKQVFLEYQAVYEEHKTFSQIIFETQIDKPEILSIFQKATSLDIEVKNKARDDLFQAMRDDYFTLKKYNLKQLHFHLPNSESFLRMHRPNKYSDSLKGVRLTVDYVNEKQAFIEGFEEGRIFNGYRFVYPLFSQKNKFLGSVEISFSALAMTKTINKTYNIDTNLLISKEVVDSKVFDEEKTNYVPSPNKDFYFEKSILRKNPKENALAYKVQNLTPMINEGEPFTVFIKQNNKIKTFIPLKNPITQKVIASIVICQKSIYIPNKYKNFYFLTSIIIFLLGVILVYIYKLTKVNNKLEHINLRLDKKVKTQLLRSRKKDLQILNQAKMASIGETLNNIAHQWRQPLSIITTSASGLKLQKDTNSLNDKDLEMFTNTILEQSSYLSNTIELFQEFIDEDKDYKKLCIQDRVNKAVDMIQDTLEFKVIKIIKDYQTEDLYINGLVGQLSQVVIYILNNAKDAILQANKDEKFIIISIYKRKDVACISIEDTGTGIDDEIIENIFEPYFTTKHKSIGTGIGLYTSYEIITNKFKGNLLVQNTKAGAKFTIELPLYENRKD